MFNLPDYVTDKAPVNVSDRFIADEQYVLNELKKIFVDSRDVFGKQVADNTQSLLDLASHYEYTPERWRFFVNGNRQFLQYNSVPEYTHDGDAHVLSPSAGDTVTLRSTDDVKYSVQYELSLTWAFQLTQSLQSGDRLRLGMFTDQDGWFFEQNDTHADDEGDFVVRRNGSEVVRETNNIEIPTTRFARLRLRTAWYRITRQLWTRSYSEDGYQENPDVARTSAEPDKGPSRGNMPLRFELTAGSGTTNLSLEAGSCAAILLNDSAVITRAKNLRKTVNLGTTGTYVPVYGFRIDPDRDVVRAEITNTDVPKFTGSGDVFCLTIAADKSKVLDSNGNQLTDSNFSTPAEMSGTNSVIEETTDIAQFPDSTGTPTTSATNPGGYQLGLATRYTSGGGNKVQTTGANVDAKRVIPDDSIAVVLARSSATGNINFEASIEQDF